MHRNHLLKSERSTQIASSTALLSHYFPADNAGVFMFELSATSRFALDVIGEHTI